MGDDGPPRADEDDHDDLAALDLSTAPGADEGSSLDALTEYVASVENEDTGDDFDVLNELAKGEDEELPVPLFTVTNPPGTVTVTTYMDGRVKQVQLAPILSGRRTRPIR